MGRAVIPAGWLDVRGLRTAGSGYLVVWPGRARAAALPPGLGYPPPGPLACLGSASAGGLLLAAGPGAVVRTTWRRGCRVIPAERPGQPPAGPGGSGRRGGGVLSGGGGGPAAGPRPVQDHRDGGRGQGGGGRDEGDLPARHATGADHADGGGRDRRHGAASVADRYR